jgi:predicted enzyme related to lactoylglutathione lyase
MTEPRVYPSWIEIPVEDLDRATDFYRRVFGLTETQTLDDEVPDARITLLAPSDKDSYRPGVSLIASPRHKPGRNGVQVNFHVGSHAALDEAMANALSNGGALVQPVVRVDDGTRYVTISDSEGNTIALSAWEAPSA